MTTRPAGYGALVERLGLEVIPNWHQSLVAQVNSHRIDTAGGVTEEMFPARYWPGDSLGDHLEFALKYDGTNLAILACIFRAASTQEVLDYVLSKPRGKYARRIWYLFELLSGVRLDIPDLSTGAYVDLLEPEEYFTSLQSIRIRRQRIRDNLLGDERFCPMIRRTGALADIESADLTGRCQEVLSNYSPEQLRRAMGYLYARETKSSFLIEHITPSSSRTERFVALLQLAERDDFCGKEQLIELQNRIVDPRFMDEDYRHTQNYVGETVAWQKERIHFVSPKPSDLPQLMAGLIDSHVRLEIGCSSPVIHAAAISYAFVFLHPFEDGNGRIHRFLIHNIMARRGVTPSGLVFPVSASMLANMAEYDASLEAFSKPLMKLIEYSLDEDGQMTVLNETATWYKFLDLTAQAEALFRFIQRTIETELVEELAFLASYDTAREAIQQVIDLPDRKIDLFIRFCLQNNGRLATRKRPQFEMLTDDEIERMEEAVQAAYQR